MNKTDLIKNLQLIQQQIDLSVKSNDNNNMIQNQNQNQNLNQSQSQNQNQKKSQSQKKSSAVVLLAVSKRQTTEKIRWAFDAGQIDFGENYVQEALQKKKELMDLPIRWHFIGALQKNKVKDVVGQFDLIHSVDSFDLAKKISQKANEKDVNQPVLIEVNLAQENSKGGFDKKFLLDNFNQLTVLPNLILSGLMILPPPCENPESNRTYFRELKDLFELIKHMLPLEQQSEWKWLSMGTTQDYIVALEEGANLVRLGTALFGERS